jgi:uroporphyrinogen decarboxylase
MQNQTPIIARALKGEKTERTPVWFMRQAGRYLPEYNAIRNGLTFLELTQNVDLACEVSLQPYRRFGVDGIIMFSDILTPINGAGVPLHFEEKKGPILERTVASEADLSLLDSFVAERDTGFVKEILQKILSHITSSNPPEVAKPFALSNAPRPTLLGFAGAPFTLASYLIEGGSTKKFEKTKALMYSTPYLFAKLSDRLADITIDYLKMQLKAGADAVQIFDSWGGILSPHDYAEFSAPYVKKIIAGIKREIPEKPVILFTGNAAHLLEEMSSLGPDAISLDWRVSPQRAEREIPHTIAVQGNMDPLILYGSVERVEREVKRVIDGFSNRDGYIFNLGHGIHPNAPIACVDAMIRSVRKFGQRG